ncbi:hypothetical protein [Polymorphospora lycopeni]|uniref:Uncharacterized protein n=1 Tax=Polymorphospora lycopeni TaxID=3140240 RepID=A0ABV5CTF8_9ACTN
MVGGIGEGSTWWARASGSRWGEAFAVLGLTGAVLLLARHLRPLTWELGGWLRFGTDMSAPDPTPVIWLCLVVWAAVVAAILANRPLVAAAAAWFGVSADALRLVLMSRWAGELAWWSILLALLLAGVLSVAALSRRTGSALLGHGRTALVVGAGVVAASAPMAESLLWVRDGGLLTLDLRRSAMLAGATYLVVAVLLLPAVAGGRPPVRRRVFALLLPIVTLLVVAQLSFDQAFSGLIPAAGPLPSGIAGLVTAPALALLVLASGVAVVRFVERTHPADVAVPRP